MNDFLKGREITSCSLEREKEVDRKGGPNGSLNRGCTLQLKSSLTFKNKSMDVLQTLQTNPNRKTEYNQSPLLQKGIPYDFTQLRMLSLINIQD